MSATYEPCQSPHSGQPLTDACADCGHPVSDHQYPSQICIPCFRGWALTTVDKPKAPPAAIGEPSQYDDGWKFATIPLDVAEQLMAQHPVLKSVIVIHDVDPNGLDVTDLIVNAGHAGGEQPEEAQAPPDIHMNVSGPLAPWVGSALRDAMRFK